MEEEKAKQKKNDVHDIFYYLSVVKNNAVKCTVYETKDLANRGSDF